MKVGDLVKPVQRNIFPMIDEEMPPPLFKLGLVTEELRGFYRVMPIGQLVPLWFEEEELKVVSNS